MENINIFATAGSFTTVNKWCFNNYKIMNR